MDNRIKAIKSGTLGLVIVVVFAVQVYTGYFRLSYQYNQIHESAIPYLLMTSPIGPSISVEEPVEWSEKIGLERIKGAEAGRDDIEYPTGAAVDAINELPYASDFRFNVSVRLPDSSMAKLVRLKPAESEPVLETWSKEHGNDSEDYDTSETFEVVGRQTYSQRDRYLFLWGSPHGDSTVPLNAADEGVPLRVILLDQGNRLYSKEELRSAILVAAQSFEVAATDPAEAFRQCQIKLKNPHIKIPVLGVEVSYLQAIFLLLALATFYIFTISSNIRQMRMAETSERSEPWIVSEPVPTANRGWWRSPGYWIETIGGRFCQVTAILIGCSVGMMCSTLCRSMKVSTALVVITNIWCAVVIVIAFTALTNLFGFLRGSLLAQSRQLDAEH